MSKTVLSAILMILAWPALAQTPVFMYGIGQQSCANWLLNDQTESEGQIWILGYWTGVNEMNNKHHLVGSETDSAAIWAETKKICVAEPSTRMVDAVARVYYQFQQTGK